MIEHPLRRALDAETHARPSVAVSAPATVFHLALTGVSSPETELDARVSAMGGKFLHSTDRQAVCETPSGRLKWERHSEFITWTLFVEGALHEALPPPWWSEFGGECVASLEVVIAPGEDAEVALAERRQELAQSSVSGGFATVQSDFRIGKSGRTLIKVALKGDDPARFGRLIRRLIELETYRSMALLALPVAQEALRALDQLESDLRSVSGGMPAVSDNAADAQLLTDLTTLAARLERVRCDVSFRLGASDAYAALFAQRIVELREERIEGSERISVFLNRRFAPAMATCASLTRRLDAAGLRIDRISALLRTRVDVAVERQNSALLTSMNERAAAQLRLQQAVEGLSVFAIAYYLTGLLERPLAALGEYWPWLDAPLIPALIAIAAVASIGLGVRRLKKELPAPQP
ncbi:MAG: DUF3422 domain-containing protein [Hyphomonadaceae bacterium]|nr:DUF3422 domain-containing protein [Hyphomonadaceae bacterium]